MSDFFTCLLKKKKIKQTNKRKRKRKRKRKKRDGKLVKKRSKERIKTNRFFFLKWGEIAEVKRKRKGIMFFHLEIKNLLALMSQSSIGDTMLTGLLPLLEIKKNNIKNNRFKEIS